jgi:hypothetical protein
MATLLKVLNNLADIKSAGGVALRVRTQAYAWTDMDSARLHGVWRPARLVTAHHGEDIQSFSSSLTALAAGEYVSFAKRRS